MKQMTIGIRYAIVVTGVVLSTMGTASSAESKVNESNDRVYALWSEAEQQLGQGSITESGRLLELALEASTDEQTRASSALRLARALTASGRTKEAWGRLAIAKSLATSLSEADRQQLAQVDGMLAARSGEFASAERHFDEAARAARAANAPLAEAQARINSLRARLDRKEIDQLETRLAELVRETSTLPADERTANVLLALGELHRRAVNEFRSSVSLRKDAYDIFVRAEEYATADATKAYAVGLLGALYEDEQRLTEAAQLTSRASFLAQAADAPDQVYRWEWQASRIEKKEGNIDASAASLDRAVTVLNGVRSDLLVSERGAYGRLIEPVYLDYADARLRTAVSMADGSEQQQQLLRGVRNHLESLKQAEVQDYFENECVASSGMDNGVVFDAPGAAVVYPILLNDRIEVLIETRGQLRRFSQPVSLGEATVTTRRLRLALESATTGDLFMKDAQSLYRWLVGDTESWLANNKVDTLVFVPSGALRTIPLGVLHDSKQFLIERYAIATTPAMSLVNARDSRSIDKMLVGGISQSVQGFSELPGVAEEIRTISSLFPALSLKDEFFKLATLQAQLSTPNFSVAHLATHGEFSANHRQSFVLTYDDRLTMDNLKAALNRRGVPLDLLVLSACRTAAGDDRAALGLAGVAVQAGAKSALASLWYISDKATAELMSSFYRNLKNNGTTKAQSLQQAQLALLQSPAYRHPSYWAPYLLIGNWL